MAELGAIICFDTEMAEDQKLIELSIFDDSLSEIYHSYYNPGRVREWREEIHHITPEMVKNSPRFSTELPGVQSVIDSAEIIVGCALRNDVDALSKAGVKRLDRKRLVEIQDWFWLLRGISEGRSLFKTASLLNIAEELGVDFSEQEAHGASADTRATMSCFLALKSELETVYSAGKSLTMEQAIDIFEERFAQARTDFLRQEAAGFVQILDHGGYHSLKFNQKVEKPNSKAIAMISVNDRFIAEMELRKLFARREVKGKHEIYNLRAADIEKFKSYSNVFEEERSAFCKQFTSNKLNKSGIFVNFR
ncbi:MAG: 3'-5' exonuclease [Bacteroidales bacterium]|nr:3'-5' exonuclease [Bacteroidales bacterium]